MKNIKALAITLIQILLLGVSNLNAQEFQVSQPNTITAQPGQFFVFKLTITAGNADLKDVTIHFSDLLITANRSKARIPAGNMTCFNTSGINFKGQPFSKLVEVPAGQCQDFWIGIDLDSVIDGKYKGQIIVQSGTISRKIQLEINVSGDAIPNHGYDQGKSLARLNWLNSTIGINDLVTKGFQPIKIEDHEIHILGRSMKIDESGLPAAIISFFGPSNQELVKTGEPLLNQPFRFIVEKMNGDYIPLQPGNLQILSQSPSKIAWKVISTADDLVLECIGQMEFDGFVDYSLKLTAKKHIDIKDIRLEILVNKDKSEYMMGLNHEGGFRTPNWQWKWDTTKNQDMLWMGAVNGGMRIKWKARNYRRPLVNIYYHYGPLNLPPSWGNEGKGGVNIAENSQGVLCNAYSGSREIQPGEVLNYDFELLLTPFRVIDKQTKFGDRYYHGGGPGTAGKIAKAQAEGANMINIHHAEDVYPFINYPYLDENIAGLTQLVSNAHQANMRMKFYYTTRELTKNLPEFKAFYSLNGEIIFPGPGDACKTIINPNGPNEWLKNNLQGKYIPAWYNLVKEGLFKGETDLSVITTPDSRLNNFYIAGLDWMMEHIGIDGVYIDDSALDRFTLMRARKVIDQYCQNGRIDLHSWNHFNEMAGFANCLNLYMDLLPYIDLVWIGEGRDYNRLPDHWLIEVSGIPFGLPGQMLADGGNAWRGMVYGITNRAAWTPNSPAAIWKFWDTYQIDQKEMIGYWEPNSPVTSSNPLVRASVYVGNGQSIIAAANWSDQDQPAKLHIDWAKLGLDPLKTQVLIPAVKDFQKDQSSVGLDHLKLPAGKGVMIILSRIK